MIFLGFLLALLMLIASIVLGGADRLGLFFDAPAVIFLLFILIGYALFIGRQKFIRFSLRGIKSFFVFSFSQDEETNQAGIFYLRLSLFTIAWGLLCIFVSLVWAMSALQSDTIGKSMSFGLLSFLYAAILTVFVFLPLWLRLSPPAGSGYVCRRLAIPLSLIGIAGFILVRFWIVILILSIQTPDRPEAVNFHGYGQMVPLAIFAMNPADPLENYSLFSGIHMIALYLDLPSLIFVFGGWWAFRLASGKRRRGIAAPILIFIGLQGTILGMMLMQTDFAMDRAGPGFMIAMLTTLYAFIGAAGFLIADMWSSFRTPPPNPPAEGTEQAKAIIDHVIESERGG